METVGTRAVNATTYAIPVAAFVALVLAILNRYFSDLGVELINAIGVVSGVIFNILYDIARYYYEKLLNGTK